MNTKNVFFVKRINLLLIFCYGLTLIIMIGCGSSRKFTSTPIKTFDPDNKTIPQPKELEENQIWDIIDLTFFYQISKPLDLNWTFREIGKLLHVASGRQADNVNSLGEVPNSSWYTNRHFHKTMSIDELVRGPNITDGPDHNDPWTVTRGKFEGGTPGFTIEDAKGDVYILKIDAFEFPEMGSSAEVISTKILHASGYNVPQNTIEYFDPITLKIGSTAKVLDQGVKRQMTQDDLEKLLEGVPRREDGKIRVLASKFLPGKPVGVWTYKGRRRDDPNDLVHHQHRRELRGLRVIGSWLNDADRRAANTLAVYTEENGNKFIKHYVIDMGSSLGSNNTAPHGPQYGNEYLLDPKNVGISFVTLGFYKPAWDSVSSYLNPQFPSVGYYESEIFDPGRWVPTYPNPAFQKCTLRDAFWGAKIVMSFKDEEIKSIVKTARMSDPKAEEYLIKTMIERRDKVGKYWFSKMNTIDKFELKKTSTGDLQLSFVDLTVEAGFADSTQTQYQVRIFKNGKEHSSVKELNSTSIVISENELENSKNIQLSMSIQTKRSNNLNWSKWIKVYFMNNNSNKFVITGIERQE